MMPLADEDKVIAIYGIGKLGLLLTQVALTKGLDVIAVDGSDKKLSMAEKYGVKQTIMAMVDMITGGRTSCTA